jgi:hypothetical protein
MGEPSVVKHGEHQLMFSVFLLPLPFKQRKREPMHRCRFAGCIFPRKLTKSRCLMMVEVQPPALLGKRIQQTGINMCFYTVFIHRAVILL